MHQHCDDIAEIPVTKEPSGLSRSNGKRPDGLTLVPWRAGKSLAWDATIASTLAGSYVEASSTLAGSASESAASKKCAKYSYLQPDHIFQPIALESLGPCSISTSDFISELDRRISLVSNDPREGFISLATPFDLPSTLQFDSAVSVI